MDIKVENSQDLLFVLKYLRGKLANHRKCDLRQVDVADNSGLTITTIMKSECDPFNITIHELNDIVQSHGKKISITIEGV